MSISEELLKIIVCPETKQRLRLGTPEEVEAINKKIKEKKLKNRSGNFVERIMDGILIREDEKVAYPIIEDIPVLLVEEGFFLKED